MEVEDHIDLADPHPGEAPSEGMAPDLFDLSTFGRAVFSCTQTGSGRPWGGGAVSPAPGGVERAVL